MECFRRTTKPDMPDNVGQRWFGKALALSRMSTDLIDVLTDCQEAAPHAQQHPVVRPEDRASLAAELARRQAAVRAKTAETPASPAAPDTRDPLSGVRPAFRPAAPAVTTRLAAAAAANLADMPAGPSAPDPRAGPSVSDPQDPMSSERPWLVPTASAIMGGPAAVPLHAPTLPRPGLRAGLLSSTRLFSRVVPALRGPAVTPAATPVKPAGS